MAWARLEDCITDIGYWMFVNRLKLKMDWLLAACRQVLSMLGDIYLELKLDTTTIATVDSVRLLESTSSLISVSINMS